MLNELGYTNNSESGECPPLGLVSRTLTGELPLEFCSVLAAVDVTCCGDDIFRRLPLSIETALSGGHRELTRLPGASLQAASTN